MRQGLIRAAAFLGLLMAPPAYAGSVTLSWDPSVGATGYEVEQSTDQGATWIRVLDLTASACSGTPARCAATLVAPSSGVVLFRFSAKNTVGVTRRYEVGSWHCQSCAPPLAPGNLGVQ